ncbi:MAG: hypothetical protein WAU42_14740 [Solirubrobacteraceae bacterium]
MPDDPAAADPNADPKIDPKADPAADPAVASNADPAVGGDPNDDDIPVGLGDAGKEALKRERASAREARKRADDLAAKVKEFEDRDKTEAQKQAEALVEAQKRADAAEREVLVHQVAAKKGLTGDLADLAHRLVGTTKEELEKDADKLLKSVGATGDSPSLDQGARGRKSSGTSANDAVNDWLRKGAGVAT